MVAFAGSLGAMGCDRSLWFWGGARAGRSDADDWGLPALRSRPVGHRLAGLVPLVSGVHAAERVGWLVLKLMALSDSFGLGGVGGYLGGGSAEQRMRPSAWSGDVVDHFRLACSTLVVATTRGSRHHPYAGPVAM